jgi:hypothetical protein
MTRRPRSAWLQLGLCCKVLRVFHACKQAKSSHCCSEGSIDRTQQHTHATQQQRHTIANAQFTPCAAPVQHHSTPAGHTKRVIRVCFHDFAGTAVKQRGHCKHNTRLYMLCLVHCRPSRLHRKGLQGHRMRSMYMQHGRNQQLAMHKLPSAQH